VEERVTSLNVGAPAKPAPPLGGLARSGGPLEPAVGLGRVGPQDLDIELLQGAAELSQAVFDLVGLVGSEDRVFIAISGSSSGA
jgi:hypothetical protein